jgi:hypothetical protein
MAIAEGKNANRSIFTLKGMEAHKDSFVNKPILCAFPSGQIGDWNYLYIINRTQSLYTEMYN